MSAPHAPLANALCALLALGLAGPVLAGPRDPLRVWTDGDGVHRYTTHEQRIPLMHRADAEVVEIAIDPHALDARIAELERRIAEDEERLAAHLSEEGASDEAELEIVAERLPRLQSELRLLLERRDALQASDAP